MDNLKKYINYIFESGIMKRKKISGFDRFMDTNSSSLAAHSNRSAIIAAIIASEEGADIQKVVMIQVFHEMPETRFGDFDLVAKKYVKNKDEIEKASFEDQLKNLPEKLAIVVKILIEEKEAKQTLETKIARDADYLEHIISAKEYVEQGYKNMEEWLDDSWDNFFQTKTGKEIFRMVKTGEVKSCDWYKEIR